MANTSAIVNMEIPNNATWEDAFRFGDEDDISWTFTGQSFRMDIKGNSDADVVLLTMSTDNGRIVVDDVNARILHFNVPDTVIQAALVPGEYVYDLIMYDASLPSIRVLLMAGKVCVTQGITGD